MAEQQLAILLTHLRILIVLLGIAAGMPSLASTP
jgi:hypothetical protein